MSAQLDLTASVDLAQQSEGSGAGVAPGRSESQGQDIMSAGTTAAASSKMPSRGRMQHWSTVKGPLTDGFRLRRERDARRQRELETSPPCANHRANHSAEDGIPDSTPQVINLNGVVFTPIVPIAQNQSTAGPAVMESLDGPEGPADTAPVNWEEMYPGIHFEPIEPVFGNNAASHPTDDAYDQFTREFPPSEQPTASGSPDRPHDYDYTQPQYHAPTNFPSQTLTDLDFSLPRSPQKRSPARSDYPRSPLRYQPYSPSRNKREMSSPRRPLKRKSSGRDLLGRERSFQELYSESAKKGGRLPNDLDSFGYGEERDENYHEGDSINTWTTLDFLKKQKKGANKEDAELPENSAQIYKTFLPRFTPKAGKQSVITTANTFTLPIPSPAAKQRALANRYEVVSSAPKVSTRKRALFRPPPIPAAGQVIEIFDDEDKRKNREDLLKGLQGSVLELAERPQAGSVNDDNAEGSSQKHKSSLYRSSKLDDMLEDGHTVQAIENNNRPWQIDEVVTPLPVAEDDVLATSMDDMGTKKGTDRLPSEPADVADGGAPGALDPSAAAANAHQLLQPLARNWVFKLFR